MALVAREVRRGRLLLHAFCLMTTHFHLLVESPEGELSEAMRVIENTYSRRFNRLRRRDGPLVRARFFSKRVRTTAYRRAVVRYIDANPVRSRIVARAEYYEFCSAASHVSGAGPRWLEQAWVSGQMDEVCGQNTPRAHAYRYVFGPRDPASDRALDRLVEARMHSTAEADPLDDLIASKPPRVRAWLARKAALADGGRVGLPVCVPSALRRAVREDVRQRGPWYVETGRSVLHGDEVASVGLLRTLCRATWFQVAALHGIPLSRARRFGELHDHWMRESADYEERVGTVAIRAMDELFPVEGGGVR